jgi:hypothetical protein
MSDSEMSSRIMNCNSDKKKRVAGPKALWTDVNNNTRKERVKWRQELRMEMDGRES